MDVKGHTGSVSFDGDFITIDRKGALARLSVGKGSKRIPTSSVTAVQWKPAGNVVNGFIQFTVMGGNESRSRFGHQTTDAASDENSVVFTKKQMADFEPLRVVVETAIIARSQPAPAAIQQPDVMAQLEQLGKLREGGVVSADEFEQQKAILLSRL